MDDAADWWESGKSHWHAMPAAAVVEALGSDPGGLTAAQAADRLSAVGPNEIPPPTPEPLWRLVLRQLRSAVVWLLLAAMGLAILTGDVIDAVAIGLVLALNMAIGVGMEAGASRALRALRSLETQRAIVVRDGQVREVDARDLVPGDVITLDEGAIVPADARVLTAAELRVDEAMLTGESRPVDKSADPPVEQDAPLPDRHTMLYRGTAAASGRARAVVVATGGRTELGRIGLLAEGVRAGRTALERKLDALGGQLAVMAIGLALLVLLALVWRGAGIRDLLQMGIALAVATVPEGLPVVATIALALGVQRMARRRALVRHLPSVEGLGSTTVVCADKTGTLTAGAMTVTSIWSGGRTWRVTGSGYAPDGAIVEAGHHARRDDPGLDGLLACAARTARASVEYHDAYWRAVGDPTDAALVTLVAKAGIDRHAIGHEAPQVADIPFSSARRLSASVHLESGRKVTWVKGAPSVVLDRCASWLTPDGEVPLGSEARAMVLAANQALAERRERVLALATGPAAGNDVPHGLTLLGLVGMTDPPAEGVLEAIGALRRAGVRVVMITGDQHATADAIARQLGILGGEGESVDSRMLEAMDAETLRNRVARVAVFSRVSPEDKLRIVEALQARGELVAMLGDGVNDAAALRQANVGVAMGRRGTDVAREAADVVLEDDRFPTIIAALEEGRVIFDNLRKFVYYLVSCNLAEMLALVAMPLLGLPVPFTPLQILWLNLVTDVVPALSLAAEPADPRVMERPPRPPRAPILERTLLRSAVGHAALLAAVTVGAFALLLHWDRPGAGAAAFLTLAVAQVLHLGNARSASAVLSRRTATANPWALVAVVACAALLVASAHVPPLASLLDLPDVGLLEWGVVVAFGAIPAIAGQLWRLRSVPVAA
jgi:Ca2+-transporting ATPase